MPVEHCESHDECGGNAAEEAPDQGTLVGLVAPPAFGDVSHNYSPSICVRRQGGGASVACLHPFPISLSSVPDGTLWRNSPCFSPMAACHGLQAVIQIGRASCRERGGQNG